MKISEYFYPEKDSFSFSLLPFIGYSYNKYDDCTHSIVLGWLFWAVAIEL